MRTADQATQDHLTLAGVDIERDAALVAVVGPPIQRVIWVRLVLREWAMSTSGRTAGRLDFDHIGAEVTEDLAAEQPTLGGKIKNTVGTQHIAPPPEKGEREVQVFLSCL